MITPEAARIALFRYTIDNDLRSKSIWLKFCSCSTPQERIQVFKAAMNDAYRHNHGTKTQFNYSKDSTK